MIREKLANTFSCTLDYRPVSGLMLPFSERALFNGVADMSLTRRIDAIQVNVPLAGTLFQPGTVER